MGGNVSPQIAVARTFSLTDGALELGVGEADVVELVLGYQLWQVDVVAIFALGVLVSGVLKKIRKDVFILKRCLLSVHKRITVQTTNVIKDISPGG